MMVATIGLEDQKNIVAMSAPPLAFFSILKPYLQSIQSGDGIGLSIRVDVAGGVRKPKQLHDR
eukprot:scaffold16295_cov19-Prasinocladus_malaysianus.AAC.1